MKKLLIGAASAGVVLLSSALPVLAVNPAGAPAAQIGTTVAGFAQTSDPNFGQAVCKPAALLGQEDNGTLDFLGLTPPGNTP